MAARRLRVEVAGRLVTHQKRRAVHDGARDGHALLFAAGQLVGALVELVLQTDEAQHLGYLRLDDVAALADYLERERDVLEHGLVRQQLEVLEHAADVAAQVGHAPVAHGGQVLVRDVDVALRGLHLSDEHADERGLAGAGMAHEEDELARVDLQGYIVKRRLVRLSRVHLRHMVERDDRRACLLGNVIDFQHRQRRRKLRRGLPRGRRVGAAASCGTRGNPLAYVVRHRVLRSNSRVLRRVDSSRSTIGP